MSANDKPRNIMNSKTCYLTAFLCCILVTHVHAFEFDDVAEDVRIHGFLSQGFLSSDANNYVADTLEGTYQFNEIGLNFSTDLTDRLHTGIQLFSRDLGDEGNNELEVDWVYGDYRWKDWLGFRAGKLKLPFGQYNETRDLDMLRTWIFLPHIYNESWRDVQMAIQGIGAYGYIPLHSMGNLNYQIQLGEMNFTKAGSIARSIEHNSKMNILDIDSSLAGGSSIEWLTPVDGLKFGASFLTLDIDITFESSSDSPWVSSEIPEGLSIPYTMEDFTFSILSAEYVWKNLTLSGEYMRLSGEDKMFDIPSTWEGQESYYASIAYRLTDWWEIGVYYSVFYPEINNKDGKGYEYIGQQKYEAWQKEVVFTSRFDLNDQWIVKLEGHSIDGAGILRQYNLVDELKHESFLFAIKTTFNF